MASFDFPGTPSNGQSYTANGITYTFDGTAWKRDTGAVKGQKGEEGTAATKGQKGEVGDKGQKGEASTVKGQKGEEGAVASKGQKGEVGADNSTKGQKGEVGAGTKGQKGEAGESGMGLNTKTSAYTLQASDEQKLITTTAAITVPSGVFSASDAVTIFNNSGSGFYIFQGSGTTLYLAGTATSGDRFLAGRGVCTIICVGTNTFAVTGGGVT